MSRVYEPDNMELRILERKVAAYDWLENNLGLCDLSVDRDEGTFTICDIADNAFSGSTIMEAIGEHVAYYEAAKVKADDMITPRPRDFNEPYIEPPLGGEVPKHTSATTNNADVRLKIYNPLTGLEQPIDHVLHTLCGQENCDGEPYDQAQRAAEYIQQLENEIRDLNVDRASATPTLEPRPKADQYGVLTKELNNVADQAINGNGHARHATPEPFERQSSMEISRRLSKHTAGAPLFQVVKKVYESGRLDHDAAIKELQGAIIYLTMAITILREDKDKNNYYQSPKIKPFTFSSVE